MKKSKKHDSEIQLKIPSDTTYLELIRVFITKVAEKVGFKKEDVDKISIAVDEACTNVMKHAYKHKRDEKLDILVKVDYQKFTVVIMDEGKPFDPNQIKLPKMDEYIAELKVGGLGIYLMKTLMDEVDYEIKQGAQNRVKMVKYFVDGDKITPTE